MPLTNRQYDAIFREYEEMQNQSRRSQLQRVDEVYKNIPQYEEVERSISSVSVAQAKKLLDGDQNALSDLKNTLHALSEKKRTLLVSAGYPEDYLAPIYHCPRCRDTGYVDGRICSCMSNPISKKFWTAKIFPHFLMNITEMLIWSVFVRQSLPVRPLWKPFLPEITCSFAVLSAQEKPF